MRNTLILGLLALVLAACGGSGSGAVSMPGTTVSASKGGTVIRAGGELTLEIPPGALTEDTQISVGKIPEEE